MKQRNNPNITKMFKGFRMVTKKIENKMSSVPQMPKLTLNKNLLKKLEKVEILTQLQHDIVAEQLEKCTITKKVKIINNEGKEEDKEEIKIVATPQYIARLCAILEKFTEELSNETA